MDQFIIDRESIRSIVRFTIEKNKDARTAEIAPGIGKKPPIDITYTSKTSLNVKVKVLVRFGVDILKATEKLVKDIKTNIESQVKVQVKDVDIIVKDVFNEKENPPAGKK